MRKRLLVGFALLGLLVGAYYAGRQVEAASASNYVARTRAAARIARSALQDLINLRAEGIRLGGAAYVSDYFTENPDLDLTQADFVAGLAAVNSIDNLLQANTNELWIDLDKLAD